MSALRHISCSIHIPCIFPWSFPHDLALEYSLGFLDGNLRARFLNNLYVNIAELPDDSIGKFYMPDHSIKTSQRQWVKWKLASFIWLGSSSVASMSMKKALPLLFIFMSSIWKLLLCAIDLTPVILGTIWGRGFFIFGEFWGATPP